jgi:hypothetical protein
LDRTIHSYIKIPYTTRCNTKSYPQTIGTDARQTTIYF